MRHFLATIFCLWGTFAGAANFFVTTTGNDSTGDGSSGNPWATGTHTIAHGLAPGDTVNIAAGFYNERLVPTVSGTAANPIKFVGTFSGNQAIATLLPQPTTTNMGFQIGSLGSPVNYVQVSGFAPHNTTPYTGFNVPGTSGVYINGHNNSISNNFAWDCAYSGIYEEARTNGGVVSYSNIIAFNACWTNGGVGISCSGTNTLVLGNWMGLSVQFSAYYSGHALDSVLDADGAYYFGWNQQWISNVVFASDPSLAQNNQCHCDVTQTYGYTSGNPMGYAHDILLSGNTFINTNTDNINGLGRNGAGMEMEGFSNVVAINNFFNIHHGVSGNTGWSNLTFLNNTLVGWTNDPNSNPDGVGLANGIGLKIQNNIFFNCPAGQIELVSVAGVTGGYNDFSSRTDR